MSNPTSETTGVVLHALLDSTDDLIWAVDAERFGLLAFNSALARYMVETFGAEVRVGNTPDDVLPADSASHWRGLYSRALCKGAFTVEHRLLTQHRVLLLSVNLLVADGKRLGVSVFGRDITQRKQAERALQESQQQLLDIATNLPGSIYQFVGHRDGTMEVTYVSARSKSLLGIDYRCEGYFDRFTDCILDADHDRFLSSIREALVSVKPWDFEGRLVKPSGELIWFKGNSVPQRRGEDVVFNGVVLDITERKQAEEALRRERDFSRTLVQSSPAFYVAVRPDGRILMMNDVMLSALGYQREEVEGRDYLELFVCKEDWPATSEAFTRVAAADVAGRVENRVRDKSGRELVVEWLGRSILRDDELDFVFGVGTDITERKAAELALRESEARYRTLLQYAPEAIVVFDVNAERFVDVNDKACHLFGYPREELLTLGLADMDAITDTGAPIPETWTRSHVAHALSGEIPVFEWKLRKVGGETRDCEVRLVRLPARDRELVRGSFVDITDRKRLEREAAEVRVRLEHAQRLEALGRLAGGIAHDFNNILGAIIGFTDLALTDLGRESPVRSLLEDVERGANRAADLVRQILAFTRKSPEGKRPIQPAVFAREVVKLIRATLPATITVKERYETSAWVLANPGQIHQIVMNLCTNAGLAMQHRGGTLEVTLTERETDAALLAQHPSLRPGRYLRLVVTDTGCGIAPDHLARVCEPFFTTRPAGEGTGLGLSVVHDIVESSGGAIGVTSELGVGTEFEVLLPICDAGDASERPKTERRAGRASVLFVDDETALVEIARLSLSRLGHRVSAFHDPGAALAAFRANPGDFDIVVTDMSMPNLTGDILAAEIRRIRADIPLVLVSGYSDRIAPSQARGVGFDAVMDKPLRIGALAQLIGDLLDRREAPPNTGR